MYGYIYLTTNLINNRKYIGQHKASSFDSNYFGSGKILLQAINKNGIENFKCVLIEEAETKQDLDLKEQYHIQINNATESEDFYNLVPGGSGGCIKGSKFVNNGIIQKQVHPSEVNYYIEQGFKLGRFPRSKEAVEKTANSNRGQKRSKESCQNISKSMVGKQVSDKARKNLSLSHKGKLPSMTGKIQVNNGIDYRFIFPEEKDMYLSRGYVLGGRTRGHSKAFGKTVVSKDGKKYYIHKDETETYLNNGYVKGFNTKVVYSNPVKSWNI